ncbi:TonB-dependent receptor [Herbaspirillum sp. WKF16]|uniref:TonB-dependent receptor n=1 Tax=Herbaspirillum sp. WKF16 TaxID=3028312 RepID=UPI0023AA097D|nr:TonB-dependent receptor [Herbaspirillum sp. WKF16]WDZ95922.1 TonB-dependent receptor [Herbaspirillum sp. WKF16]
MTKRNKAATAALVLAACQGWNAAHAAEGDGLNQVEVTGNYDNSVGSSSAASQGTVNGALIANRPTLRTGEILEFVPGMIVTQHSGDGKANQYFLRGFNLDHGTDFATYIDGMPVNMRTHAHGQGYTDINFLIPELVERIDYKKGPYFADEGDFASAGAAHLRLANTLPQGIASLSAGAHGYQRAVLADSFAAGNGKLLYGLEVTRNNGPWDNAEAERKYSGALRYSAGTRADGYEITAMAYSNRWNSSDQIPQRAVQSGQVGRFGAIDPSDGGNTSRLSLSYAMHKRDADGLFQMNAYLVQSKLDLYNDFTYFLANPGGGDQFHQSEKRRMAGFDANQTWFGKLGAMDMTNKLGLQGRYDWLSPVALYNTTAREQTGVVSQSNVREGSIGAYAENTVQWADKFRTIAGVRYDAYRFNVNSSIAGNSGSAGDHIASPKLSLIFGPWAQTEYFINYGTGFHSNDARGTTQTRLPNGDPASPVTPLVRTKGYEVGARTEIVPGLQSSLSLWRLDIDSELVFVGDAGETQASRASKRYGVEWNNHYIASAWLMFDIDLAASRARYAQDDPAGNYIPGSIDKVASFGVTLTDLGRWSGAFQLRYFGPRPLIEDNSVRSQSTTLAYARVAYKIDARTRVGLDIFNLFNRKASDIDYYYPSRLPGEATDGVNDMHFHPVEPRTLRLTLTRNF